MLEMRRWSARERKRSGETELEGGWLVAWKEHEAAQEGGAEAKGGGGCQAQAEYEAAKAAAEEEERKRRKLRMRLREPR